jgi:subtilisin family serine protease
MQESPKQRRAAYLNRQAKFYLPVTDTQFDTLSVASVRREALRGYSQYYARYGVTDFHQKGIKGAGVNIFIIDCGNRQSGNLDLVNAKVVNLFGTVGGSSSPHGMAVAALVAAIDNGDGFSGIAPEANVTLLDVHNASGEIKLSSVLKALHYVASNAAVGKVDIVNISLGTAEPDDDLQLAVQGLVQMGVHVFAAAGNSGGRTYEFPAACPGVISVGSLQEKPTQGVYLPSTFNSRNDSVTVFAPGQRIGTNLSDAFDLTSMDGTSFASPFAAAVLALRLCEIRTGTVAPNSALVPLRGSKTLTLTRDSAITYLRNTFSNDCTNHLYVQENFGNYGCKDHNFSGSAAVISPLMCKRQTRLAIFWGSVAFFLAVALIITLTAKTKLCRQLITEVTAGGRTLLNKFCRFD